ncbi:hypothetical protein KSS87_016853 [Heliosperma pusillum]|nr:hypothetical protein KSS87_016853 [Heliosperma pusillum]
MSNLKELEPYLVKNVEEYNASRPESLQFMSPKQMQHYDAKLTDTYGFDVDDCPGFMQGKVVPIRKKTREWCFSEKAAIYAAIAFRKEVEHPPLKSITLIKANNQAVGGLMYYLTFRAVDAVSVQATYQAKVWLKPGPDLITQYLAKVPGSERQVRHGSVSGKNSSTDVIRGFNYLVTLIRSQEPSSTYAKVRKVASRKWRALSEPEKLQFIVSAAKKRQK